MTRQRELVGEASHTSGEFVIVWVVVCAVVWLTAAVAVSVAYGVI